MLQPLALCSPGQPSAACGAPGARQNTFAGLTRSAGDTPGAPVYAEQLSI